MTKKVLLIITILGIAILSVAAVSPALAAEPLRIGPDNDASQGTGDGNGNQGSLGTGTGVPVEQNINLDGALEDLIHANLAASLGIPLDELNARLDAGETISEIALSLGFDPGTISDMLAKARADALAQAVVLGLITQEQADWLASRGTQTPGTGDGVCDDDCTPDGIEQKMNTRVRNKQMVR
jgi:hypothetical protein